MGYRRIETARLWHVLDYNPLTGIFRWRNPTAKWMKVGGIAGSPNNKGYWQIMIDGVLYKSARLAWQYVTGIPPDREIDHRNADVTDNRFANLRLVTGSQNCMNKGKYRSNSSGFKGVSFHKLTSKWQANIGVRGKQIYLGLFDTAEQAHDAYTKAARENFKEFVREGVA